MIKQMSKGIYDILEESKGPLIREYRRKWDLAGKGKIELKYPLHINFELTFGCNLRCEFCTYRIPIKRWNYKVEPKKRILFEKYCEIVDEGAKNSLCSISLNGHNEPLLNRDIFKHIEYAHKKGILEISLHTNGLLLDDDFSNDIIDSNLDILMISIDAFSKNTYEEIRGSKDYDRLVMIVNNFLEFRKKKNRIFPLVRVSFIKNKVNCQELNDFVLYWKERVDFIEIQSFNNLFIGQPEYKFIDGKYHLDDFVLKNCYDPYRRLSIQNNGNVFPCCSTYGNEVIIGNIYNNSVYDIWNNEKTKKIRKIISGNNLLCNPKGCVRCKNSGTANNDLYKVGKGFIQ